MESLHHYRKEIEALPEDERLGYAIDLIDYLLGDNMDELNFYSLEFGTQPAQSKILSILNEQVGNIVSKDQLHNRLRSLESDVGSKTDTVHIYQIRKKLQNRFGDEEVISTIWGLGWRLNRKLYEPKIKHLGIETNQKSSELVKPCGLKWSSDEDRLLKIELEKGFKLNTIAKVLGRPEDVVRARIRSLSLDFDHSLD